LAEVIDKLAAADVNLSEPLEVTEHGQGPLSGKVVVVTGKMTGPFEGLGRTEMNALIEKAGGKAGGSVCAKTSILKRHTANPNRPGHPPVQKQANPTQLDRALLPHRDSHPVTP
jgi:DNA ligase (NAD+)